MIRLNLMAPMTICHHFLPDLKSFSSSVIINITSPVAIHPTPSMASYGASKAALHNLSLALGEEWATYGILVQTLVPGPTRTDFDNGRLAAVPRFVKKWDPAEKVVKASLAGIENEKRLVITASGFMGQKIFWALAPTKTALRVISNALRP